MRSENEQPELSEIVMASVNTDEERREFMTVGRSMAEKVFEDGAIAHARRSLLRLLNLRFGEIPSEVADRVRSSSKLNQLDKWLDGAVIAKKLDDVGILRRAPSRA